MDWIDFNCWDLMLCWFSVFDTMERTSSVLDPPTTLVSMTGIRAANTHDNAAELPSVFASGQGSKTESKSEQENLGLVFISFHHASTLFELPLFFELI